MRRPSTVGEWGWGERLWLTLESPPPGAIVQTPAGQVLHPGAGAVEVPEEVPHGVVVTPLILRRPHGAAGTHATTRQRDKKLNHWRCGDGQGIQWPSGLTAACEAAVWLRSVADASEALNCLGWSTSRSQRGPRYHAEWLTVAHRRPGGGRKAHCASKQF